MGFKTDAFLTVSGVKISDVSVCTIVRKTFILNRFLKIAAPFLGEAIFRKQLIYS